MTITHISDDPSERREKYELDKTAWGPGPWHSEPDWVQWLDTETGFPCLIRRNALGAWCGYIAVAHGHPWYGLDRSEILVDVHGGVSFADGPDATDPDVVPEPGDMIVASAGTGPALWWIGFDCGHADDLQPVLLTIRELPTGYRLRELPYRDQPYAEAMVRYLAVQAAEAFGR